MLGAGLVVRAPRVGDDGGFASWHTTEPSPMDCRICATPMHLLLTIDSSE
ncbi:hypothetical protein ABZ934_23730 [Streptomyces sp. NPDC046557]